VGFQLSFAATLGLLLYAEPLQTAFVRWAKRWLTEETAERLAGPAGDFFLFTFAAQLTTTPLMVYHFGQFSPLSLAANACILPIQPAVMLLGGAATLLGLIWLPLGQLAAWVAWPSVALTIRTVSFFARWPAASIQLGSTGPALIVLFLGLLLGGTAAVKAGALARFHPPKLPIPVSAMLALLGVACAVVWRMVGDLPDGRLYVTVLDVGAGDAVLIQSPTGRFALVDGGSSPVILSEQLGARLPLLERKLDFVVLNSQGYDQMAGLAGSAGRAEIGTLLVLGDPGGSVYQQLVEAVAGAGSQIAHGKTGQRLDLGAGAELTVLAVGESGGVLEIRYGTADLLLATGADPALISELSAAQKPGPVHVALLAGGGHEAVNPEAWLDLLNPWLAVVSRGADEGEGQLSALVLEHLGESRLLRTDRDGWIEVVTDGRRMWVSAEHAQ
jgi:competence protein ComEC